MQINRPTLLPLQQRPLPPSAQTSTPLPQTPAAASEPTQAQRTRALRSIGGQPEHTVRSNATNQLSPALAAQLQLMLGSARTSWQESIGDEGPIPYSEINLAEDGTYSAHTYTDKPEKAVDGTWTADRIHIDRPAADYLNLSFQESAVRDVPSSLFWGSASNPPKFDAYAVDVSSRAYTLAFPTPQNELPEFIKQTKT